MEEENQSVTITDPEQRHVILPSFYSILTYLEGNSLKIMSCGSDTQTEVWQEIGEPSGESHFAQAPKTSQIRNFLQLGAPQNYPERSVRYKDEEKRFRKGYVASLGSQPDTQPELLRRPERSWQ